MAQEENIIKGISVIMCCYNSAGKLHETIKHLAQQNIPDNLLWEVIIVDNASTDNTSEIALKEWNCMHLENIDFKIIQEKRPGLNFARMAGIRNASHNYILFCDDDNWLTADYILNGFRILEKNESIGILGGLGIPQFEIKEPEWFDKYKMFYAVGKQHESSGDLSNIRGWVYGAGFFLRKKAIRDLDSISFITTDRNGLTLSSGGDIELCFRVLLNNYSIWYDEKLTFYHFIERKKLNLEYLKKMMLEGARSRYKLDGLCYKSKAQKGWFSQKIQRIWVTRFVIDFLKPKEYQNKKEFSFLFLMKLHVVSLISLLKLNSNYDKSFM